MAVYHSFANWPEYLREYAIRLFTRGGILAHDATKDAVEHTAQADEIRRQMIANDPVEATLWWMAFGVGVECLAKAVLLKHRQPLVRCREPVALAANVARQRFPMRASRYALKKPRTDFPGRAKDVPEDDDALRVYQSVSSVNLKDLDPAWVLPNSKPIKHPLEIDSGTLGDLYKGNKSRKQPARLYSLVAITKLGVDEFDFLQDALRTLADIRRNVDLHVHLKSITAGSMNNDLALYLKAVNLLLDVYQR